ncbi:hypothetical protein C440_04933 [Haloferax mucosum ATCC BAA-1512]|uniref:Uncharacterized protein n=1 Tax=Haloferax mucosum ATCC BAA-1512 TaxID=662479 RepID=M0ILX8_9EURY|nr:hypothetical protein [Haloferax mucosum]ELZ96464.1 hypothetical protein C440_04933 [Haloferax mucosum ATCC BAA-1512]
MEEEQDDTQDPLNRLKQAVPSSAVTALVLGGLTAGVMSGELTVPPVLIDVLIGATIAGVIGYIGGMKLADIFSTPPEYEEVAVADSERETFQTWFVPRDGWENRRNESMATSGAYLMEGSKNHVVRELDWDDEEEVAVIEQAPARSKIGELTDVEVETFTDAIWRQRGHFRDKTFEYAEVVKSLPEIRDEMAADYYSNETRELEEKGEHDAEVVFGPVDQRVQEVRQNVRQDDLTPQEQAAREILRDNPGADPSDFERLDTGDENAEHGGESDE